MVFGAAAVLMAARHARSSSGVHWRHVRQPAPPHWVAAAAAAGCAIGWPAPVRAAAEATVVWHSAQLHSAQRATRAPFGTSGRGTSVALPSAPRAAAAASERRRRPPPPP